MRYAAVDPVASSGVVSTAPREKPMLRTERIVAMVRVRSLPGTATETTAWLAGETARSTSPRSAETRTKAMGPCTKASTANQTARHSW